MRIRALILFLVFFELTATACIWDAETALQERWKSPDLAKAIQGETIPAENPNVLRERIKKLEANRHENDPDWWNNLAGAHLRLNEPEPAVKLLEPIIQKFPDNYGIHANLGTAYHLLGRYADAEKEIARDLEINPEGHFGLEKYHLALLQYLVRNPAYQSRHLYVDEFTSTFFSSEHGRFYYTDANEQVFKTLAQDYANADEAEADYKSFSKTNHDESALTQRLAMVAVLDAPPFYRSKWNLATNSHFEAGVIYMAQMNPKEPACFEMLGIAAWREHRYHLANSAFEKAIALGSFKTDLLKNKIAGIKDYIRHSPFFGENTSAIIEAFLIFVLIPLLVGYYFYAKRRDRRRRAEINA
jgi:Flp pilus assembly protein TadD